MTDRSDFTRELEILINRHRVENESNTPDFILAQYLQDCLDAWARSSKARDTWYGFNPWSKEPLPLPDGADD